MQPLQPIQEGHFCISGNVTIAPSASIAPGVLLQADPNCQLVIAANVCIGAGSVIHAHHGILEIASGVTVGAGVLIVSGRIGADACVGARSTLWNVEIAAEQVVPADSLMGETGRTTEIAAEQADQVVPTDSLSSEPDQTGDAIEPSAELERSPAAAATDPILADPPRSGVVIYGKVGLNRLMESLFPYRQSLNGLPPNSPTDSDQAQ